MAILKEIPAEAALDESLNAVGTNAPIQEVTLDAEGNPVALPPEGSGWVLDDSEEELEDDEEPDAQKLYEEVEESRLSESLEFKLDLLIWCMPFVFLFEIMNILIQQQYQMELSWQGELKTLVSRLPRTYQPRRSDADLFILFFGQSSFC